MHYNTICQFTLAIGLAIRGSVKWRGTDIRGERGLGFRIGFGGTSGRERKE